MSAGSSKLTDSRILGLRAARRTSSGQPCLFCATDTRIRRYGTGRSSSGSKHERQDVRVGDASPCHQGRVPVPWYLIEEIDSAATEANLAIDALFVGFVNAWATKLQGTQLSRTAKRALLDLGFGKIARRAQIVADALRRQAGITKSAEVGDECC